MPREVTARRASRLPPLWIGLTLVAFGCADGVVGPLQSTVVRPFDSLFAAEYPDFNADARHPSEGPEARRRVGVLEYRAEVIAVDTSLASDPMWLLVRVTVRNPTPDPAELRLAGCPVRPEAYEEAERATAAYWRAFGPVTPCVASAHSAALPAGSSKAFEYRIWGAVFAGAFPKDGRYYFNVMFAEEDTTLVFRAGSVDVRLRLPGLLYRVQVQQAGTYGVRAAIGIGNGNETPARLATPCCCAVEVWLYRDGPRTDLARRWYHRTCAGRLVSRDLPPGAFAWLPEASSKTLTLAELLSSGGGDEGGLDPGLYHLSVAFWHNWRRYEFPAGMLYFW